MTRFGARIAAALLCATGLTGCLGYHLGYDSPGGIETISIPIFDNHTLPLRREVEFELARALKREIEVRSDLRLAQAETADARLEGAITRFNEGVLTEGLSDTVQSSGIFIEVQLKLVQRNGRILFDDTITDQETFQVNVGETVTEARAIAVQEIAQRIVATLEDWR